jgi:hypothetical protein
MRIRSSDDAYVAIVTSGHGVPAIDGDLDELVENVVAVVTHNELGGQEAREIAEVVSPAILRYIIDDVRRALGAKD